MKFSCSRVSSFSLSFHPNDPQATATSNNVSPKLNLMYTQLFNDTSFISSYTTGTYLPGALPALPFIAAFNPTAPTSAPLYSIVAINNTAYPSGATCAFNGGYGFGCALALKLGSAVTPASTLGNGKVGSGGGNTLAALSASTPQSGMCMGTNTAPMPRPSWGATPQVTVNMLFYMTNTSLYQV